MVSLRIFKISSILNYSSSDSSHPSLTIHLMICIVIHLLTHGPMDRSLNWLREEDSLKAPTELTNPVYPNPTTVLIWLFSPPFCMR